MKRCSYCKVEKDESEFYADKKSKDGLRCQCKKCHCLTSVRTRDNDVHRENNKKWMRQSRYHTRQEVRDRDLLRSRVKNKSVEAKARHLANVAVRLGFLIRPEACPKCNRTDLKIHAHHEDHSKPLEVIWMCSDCHGKVHRKYETTGSLKD